MDPIALIQRAIAFYRSDNLARARAAFAGFSSEQLQKEYGQSGQTCQQVLDGYEEHERNCDSALELIEKLEGKSR